MVDAALESFEASASALASEKTPGAAFLDPGATVSVNLTLDRCASTMASGAHSCLISRLQAPSGFRSSRPWKLPMVVACVW